MTPLETAKQYQRRGWQPIPIPHRSKNPNLPGWQNFKTTEADLPKHFNGKQQNIGVLLGAASSGLCDIDLDSVAAVKIADCFLPPTESEFGRAGKPRSHRLYICKDATFEKFNNPFLVNSKDEKERKNACIVELRTGNGLQTIFPGSMHETGESVEWHADGEPLQVDAQTLRRAVALLACACLVSTFWHHGKRNELNLALCGGMLRNGFDVPEVKNFIKAICAAANDEESDDRLKAIDATAEKLRRKEKVCGFPKLAELTDKKLVEIICAWLQIESKNESKAEPDYKNAYNAKNAADDSENETKIKPFPVPGAKCFHGLAGEYVRMIEAQTESDSAALLIQFLTYFGNIVGRAAYYQVEADKHFTNLFCVLVGDTASGRKGTSFGRVKEIFRGEDEAHEKDCIVSGLASGEGLLYQIRDAVYEEKTDKKTKKVETVCTDNGVSDKRLLIVEGEFSQVLRVQGRECNTLSAFLRNLWDNGTARNLTKNSPLRTTDAHVSVIGHITKTELLTCLNEVESVNGYANRFLWFAVRRSKFLPFGAGEIDSYQLANFQRKLSERIRFSQTVNRMIFTAETRNLFASVYQTLETSRFGFLAKITQRATAYVCRLSCLFALLDGKDEIEREHLEAGLAVWQYAEDSARYIFGGRIGDKTAETILNALRESENGLTRTEIRDLFDRHITKEKLDAALQFLLENNLAQFEKTETAGRTKEIWFACVLSVLSVLSPENLPDEQPFNAKNAYNAKNATEDSENEDYSVPAGTEV
jgi:hypothetical protein